MEKSRWEEIDRKDGDFITANLFGTSPATAGNYGVFFTAIRPVEILEISEVHEVAGSDGNPVTLQIEKLTGTTAPNSGTNILTTAFDLRGTANTVVSKSSTDLAKSVTSDGVSCRVLSEGDRLALKDSGTLTAVAGLQVTVYLKFFNRGNYL